MGFIKLLLKIFLVTVYVPLGFGLLCLGIALGIHHDQGFLETMVRALTDMRQFFIIMFVACGLFTIFHACVWIYKILKENE